MMPRALFSPATIARHRALNVANLPHTADIETGTQTRQPGGTFTTVWSVTVNDAPCRLATVGTPAERLTAGAFAEVKEFRVAFDVDVSVTAAQRLTVTHDIPGIPSPLVLYVTGSTAHSFEMERVVLATTEGGQ